MRHHPFVSVTREWTLRQVVQSLLMAPVAILRLILLAGMVFVCRLLGGVCVFFLKMFLLFAFCTGLALVLIAWVVGTDCSCCCQSNRGRKLREGFMKALCRSMLFALGYVWIQEHGVMDAKARLLVSTHNSFVDVLYFGSRVIPVGVAKASLASSFFVGRIIRAVCNPHVLCHVYFFLQKNNAPASAPFGCSWILYWCHEHQRNVRGFQMSLRQCSGDCKSVHPHPSSFSRKAQQ